MGGAAPTPHYGVTTAVRSASSISGAWTALGSYGAVQLEAYKPVCSPTPTQSTTPSPSPTMTQTPSLTPSLTPSQSLTQSQTASGTPSQSHSPSQSQSQSSSQSGTQSPSMTPTPTPTGRPEQVVVSNLGAVDPSAQATFSAASTYAVGFAFVEGDDQCGPGRYRMTSVTLTLSRPPSTPSSISLVIWLYNAAPDGTPTTPVTFVSSLVSVDVVPANVSFALPAAMSVDSSASLNPAFAVAFSPSNDVYWNAPLNGGANMPGTGTASALGLFSIANGPGHSWAAVSSPTYGAVRLAAVKEICSPSSTPTQTQTQSPSVTQTPTGTLTGSVTQSPSASATRSQSITRSVTQTQTRSETQTRSQSQSPSLTQSASLTQSGSQAATPSGSGSASITQSRSQVPTPSQTQSQSLSPSETQSGSASTTVTPSCSGTPSATGSASASPSLTGSRSPSQTTSRSLSSSQSASPTATGHPIQFVFDNTRGTSGAALPSRRRALAGDGVSGLGHAPRSLSGSHVDVTTSDAYGIVFHFVETDAMCGPGQYDFQDFYLALSAPATVVASISVQLWENFNVPGVAASLRASTSAVVTVGTTAAYATVPLSALFSLDSSVDGPVDYTLVFQVSGREGARACACRRRVGFFRRDPGLPLVACSRAPTSTGSSSWGSTPRFRPAVPLGPSRPPSPLTTAASHGPRWASTLACSSRRASGSARRRPRRRPA